MAESFAELRVQARASEVVMYIARAPSQPCQWCQPPRLQPGLRARLCGKKEIDSMVSLLWAGVPTPGQTHAQFVPSTECISLG